MKINITIFILLGAVLWITLSSTKQKETDLGDLEETEINSHSPMILKMENKEEDEIQNDADCYEGLDMCVDEKRQVPDLLNSESKSELEKVELSLIFSSQSIEDSFVYEVNPGDTLSYISEQYGTTIDLIKISNQLEGSIIKVGQRLKIIKGEFHVLIDTSSNTLDLFLNDKLVKTYSVGTAKYRNTPIGEFKIINKVVDPTWYAPGGGVYPYGDPNNVIGTRWMGIDAPGYGIHGTVSPESIGQYVSQGCVRMLNKEVEELFKIIPIGTKVNIVDAKET